MEENLEPVQTVAQTEAKIPEEWFGGIAPALHESEHCDFYVFVSHDVGDAGSADHPDKH